MKIKWLYKIPLVTAASALVSPMIVSCSVEKPKVETQQEKEKRLEQQRALQIAPNLTKFMKEYNDKLEKGNAEFVVDNIKQLKEHTANINHLNDFEKSYIGLYEDIQNFFNNSIHKYTKDNISFDYWDNETNESESKPFWTNLKLEESTLTQEQIFYHKIYQILNDKEYSGYDIETNKETRKHFKEALEPLINEKIAEFSKKHKDFQFKNPELKFKYGENGEKIIEVSVEVEYQNQKLPKEIVIPLTFNLKSVKLKYLNNEKELVELFNKEANNKEVRKNVKTFGEMENILKSKDNRFNKKQLIEIKKHYDYTLKVIEEDKDMEI